MSKQFPLFVPAGLGANTNPTLWGPGHLGTEGLGQLWHCRDPIPAGIPSAQQQFLSGIIFLRDKRPSDPNKTQEEESWLIVFSKKDLLKIFPFILKP